MEANSCRRKANPNTRCFIYSKLRQISSKQMPFLNVENLTYIYTPVASACSYALLTAGFAVQKERVRQCQ
jgi:hypothetical protein